MRPPPGAPLPVGLRLVLDRSVRAYRDGLVLAGGDPVRALRLSPAGRAAVAALVSGAASSEAARALGRRLVDGGLAHPRPAPTDVAGEVTVVVPVRDRAEALERCLRAIGAGAPVVVVDDGSRDPAAIAGACERHGAALVRRARPGGPGAARNSALARVATPLVAFVDSDCEPEPGWLEALAGHFDDPLVGAVAPRVRPPAPRAGASTCERFAANRSPLDMGPRPARVAPGGRVAYVPAAALVLRRAALADVAGDGAGSPSPPARRPAPFDPALRHGEDVDLVWRLHDAGWRVRYEPATCVRHAEPTAWRAWLGRRHRYGTSAAPLHRRHPGRLAPVVLRPWPAAATALLLARRPLGAAALTATHGAVLARRARRTGVPVARAFAWSAVATARTVVGVGRAATALAAPALVLLLAPPLHEYRRRRPPLDPLRFAVACLADDAAYGVGVWRGCGRERTLGPVLPARRAPR